ncbi:formylglycine-generating enzyme family protein [Prolixibacteraceae bacterium JC049]|nr:formylglycine-generating enzyme family protein [Prolixibacteraceae bacterium JC049]
MNLNKLMKYTLVLFVFQLVGQMGIAQEIKADEMVLVPAGEFIMGCNPGKYPEYCAERSRPEHKVYVDAFWIDKYKVTFKRYNKCVADKKCTKLYEGAACNSGMTWNANHPVNCVNFLQAKAFCESIGRRLPTEAEWEKAARGTDGRLFPWGNELASCDYAIMNQKVGNNKIGPGCGRGTTMPVGSRPKGVSPYGAMDMAGNLFEWTSDWYDAKYFEKSPYKNPKGPATGTKRVLKGSSWLMRTSEGVVSNGRSGYSELGQGYVVGFRCAKSVK